MSSDVSVIAQVCGLLALGDRDAAGAALRAEYPFSAPTKSGRRFTLRETVSLFVRDGFIDRYSGDRLVFPPVLRIISAELPEDFPFQKNWKMAATHPAYWDLLPTIDHVVPVAQAGLDSETNWVTTSMRRNAAKGSFTAEQMGWTLHPPGSLAEWDGLTGWLLEYLRRHPDRGADRYVVRWTNELRLHHPIQA